MTLHPRHVPVEEARRELSAWVLEWEWRHGLTEPEYLELLHDQLGSRLRIIRQDEWERAGTKPRRPRKGE
jgi:hypothetical protein